MTTHNTQHKREGDEGYGRGQGNGTRDTTTNNHQWEWKRQAAAGTQSKMRAAGDGQQKGWQLATKELITAGNG